MRTTAALCTPAGLEELAAALADPEEWLIAACGSPGAGFISLLASHRPPRVADLLTAADLEEAAARLTLALADPPEPPCPPVGVSRDVLVVGGGIGGVQAALDLADAGVRVYLLDASLSIGGTMAQLDKTFPTLDCSICILGPRLVEAAIHPNIELITWADLTAIRRADGDFTVELIQKPRYVDMSSCVGCGACSEVCPVILPSRWQLGLKARKCIRIVFAQAVPLRATVEKEYCIDCRLCLGACERGAIDLAAESRPRGLTVGAIILATGARPFDPRIKGEYRYGVDHRVLTGLEFERLICATGPTGGALLRPDGRPLKRLAFIQCVGSRDRRFLPYCSGVCCTASLKQAMVALEHDPDLEITIFYNDIRTSSKGAEELYVRARAAGVRFIKGLPGRIEAGSQGGLAISVAPVGSGGPIRLEVDLTVLAVGLTPPASDPLLNGLLTACDPLGFYQGTDPVLAPLDATTPGVFLAGTCQGPKDIAETVCQGSAAAGRVLNFLAGRNRPA
jgi:heterodisulfide reductase subunit A